MALEIGSRAVDGPTRWATPTSNDGKAFEDKQLNELCRTGCPAEREKTRYEKQACIFSICRVDERRNGNCAERPEQRPFDNGFADRKLDFLGDTEQYRTPSQPAANGS